MAAITTPILVTGASGFVGANIIHQLVAAGAEVHAIVRGDSKLWRLDDVVSKIRRHRCDLTDRENLNATIAAIKPKTIFHLAAYGGYHYQHEPNTIFSTNILGTLHLLEACAEVGFDILVNTGSSSEYGKKDDPMREDMRLEPNTAYAVAKACQTLYGQYLARARGLPIVTLRLFSVYGPYEEPTRLLPTLITRATAHLPLKLVDPNTARDFIFVTDVVSAYLKAATANGLRGKVINIGSGRQTTMREVVETILRLTQSRSPVEWHAYPARSFDTDRWVSDNAQFISLLTPPRLHTLEAGLRQTVDWMNSNRHHYPC